MCSGKINSIFGKFHGPESGQITERNIVKKPEKLSVMTTMMCRIRNDELRKRQKKTCSHPRHVPAIPNEEVSLLMSKYLCLQFHCLFQRRLPTIQIQLNLRDEKNT